MTIEEDNELFAARIVKETPRAWFQKIVDKLNARVKEKKQDVQIAAHEEGQDLELPQ